MMGVAFYLCKTCRDTDEFNIYRESELRIDPCGEPVCEYCWTEYDDNSDNIKWSDLPKFIPEKDRRIQELEVRIAELEETDGSNWIDAAATTDPYQYQINSDGRERWRPYAKPDALSPPAWRAGTPPKEKK